MMANIVNRKDLESDADRTVKKEVIELDEEIETREGNSKHFVVSSIKGTVGAVGATLNRLSGKGTGPVVDETMIFVSDSQGNIDNHLEVVCVEPHDHEEAVRRLLEGETR